jgi:transglutaminase-like putative cysteine protease
MIILFDVYHLEGGIIYKKLFLSVLLFFSLALVLNASTSSAAAVNQTNVSTSVVMTNASASDVNSNPNTDTDIKSVSVSTNQTNSNNTTAAGGSAVVKTPVVVNGLTIAQLDDGICRVQAFYAKYGRYPSYVSFGTRKIPIATFKKNIATQGTTTVYSVSHPNTSSVAALAKSLAAGSTSRYMTAVRIFNWVRDKLGYSFYYGTKYGAAGTLKHMTGNCCDTANLLVALARDDGIRARYVHGYCHFNSGNWYDHVWAQLYVNSKWYTADAISFSNSFGVIKNWNTATYKLEGIYNTLPF